MPEEKTEIAMADIYESHSGFAQSFETLSLIQVQPYLHKKNSA
jgi:hypothetical protein